MWFRHGTVFWQTLQAVFVAEQDITTFFADILSEKEFSALAAKKLTFYLHDTPRWQNVDKCFVMCRLLIGDETQTRTLPE